MRVAEIIKESVEIDSTHIRELKIDLLDEATITKLYRSIILIYENKFSFIREFVQNAYDAVVEIWENKYINILPLDKFLIENPIILGMYKDESDKLYIEIKETKGAGISKDRMLNIFENITKTTKDNSLNQIGAKGIGKLSALAYTDEYFIETVYDFIKYNYKVTWYNQSGVPKIIKLSETLTKEENYTSIKVYIDDHDKDSFGNSIVNFLPYFNNIFYINTPISYNSKSTYTRNSGGYYNYSNTIRKHDGFNTNPLHNYKTFMFRENVVVFDELHLVVDKIPYKINWKELGIADKICLPLAIKCSSEFILLNDNRDSIRYTKEVKKYILNKINEFKHELYELLPKIDFDLYLDCKPLKIGNVDFYPHQNVIYNYKNDDNIFNINLNNFFKYNHDSSLLNVVGVVRKKKLLKHSNYLRRATKNNVLYYKDISLSGIKVDVDNMPDDSYIHNDIPIYTSYINKDKLKDYEELYLKVVSSKYKPISNYIIDNNIKKQYKQNDEVVGYLLTGYTIIKERTVVKLSNINDEYIVFSSEEDLDNIKSLKKIIDNIVNVKKKFLIVAPTYYKKIPYNFEYFAHHNKQYSIYCTFKHLSDTDIFNNFKRIFNIMFNNYNIDYQKLYKVYKKNYISDAFKQYTNIITESTSKDLLNSYSLGNSKYIDDNMNIDNDLIAFIENIIKLYYLNPFLLYINYDKAFDDKNEDFIADLINKNLIPIN